MSYYICRDLALLVHYIYEDRWLGPTETGELAQSFRYIKFRFDVRNFAGMGPRLDNHKKYTGRWPKAVPFVDSDSDGKRKINAAGINFIFRELQSNNRYYEDYFKEAVHGRSARAETIAELDVIHKKYSAIAKNSLPRTSVDIDQIYRDNVARIKLSTTAPVTPMCSSKTSKSTFTKTYKSTMNKPSYNKSSGTAAPGVKSKPTTVADVMTKIATLQQTIVGLERSLQKAKDDLHDLTQKHVV